MAALAALARPPLINNIALTPSADMINGCDILVAQLIALELLVEVEDSSVLAGAVHVACAAPTAGVFGSGVGLGGGDGGGWELRAGFGGDGAARAVAGAAAAEGHAGDVAVLGEGLVEGVAGHFG